MEIWTLIVKSNTFNFLILFGLIVFVYKRFKLGNIIETAKQNIKKTVENSDETKQNSIEELNKANEIVKNVTKEVKDIFENAQRSGIHMSEKILKDAEDETQIIFDNTKKVLEAEGKKTVLSLTQKTALASVEVAKKHILDTLEHKPEYHKSFIQNSIDELDRLKTNE